MGSQGQYHDPTPQKSISQSLTAIFQSTLIRTLLRNGGNSKGSRCLLPEVLTQRDVSVGPLRASELSCTGKCGAYAWSTTALYPVDKPGARIRQPYGSTEGGNQSPERPRLLHPELGLTARLTAGLEIWRDASSFHVPKVAYE